MVPHTRVRSLNTKPDSPRNNKRIRFLHHPQKQYISKNTMADTVSTLPAASKRYRAAAVRFGFLVSIIITEINAAAMQRTTQSICTMPMTAPTVMGIPP